MTEPWAKILADSISDHSPRLTSMLVRMPRCVLAEFNTHRVFSRNAASSRAIPIERMIQQVINDPFIPLSWGRNQPGMQAGAEHDGWVNLGDGQARRASAWLWARDKAVESARAFAAAGYHKQIVNRLLEPWMWTTVVVTATQWSNFFALRRHEAAEPHIHLLADRMWEAMQASSPRRLWPGEWHLPFVDWVRMDDEGMLVIHESPMTVRFTEMMAIKMSVARCASTSYDTVDGFAMTANRAVDLHDKLVGSRPMHASPCEHQARVPLPLYGKIVNGKATHAYNQHGGNLGPGWIQYRKTLAGEAL